MTWDDNNELTAITNSNATIANGYGADGLRGWSEVGSNAKSYYVYIGGALLGEVNATGSPLVAYTWGNGLISEHRYDTTTPTSFWYLFGPQGETRYLTNSAGAVTDTYTYSAYGEPVASTGTDTNPFRYGGALGYYSDSNTGLILCGDQWFDPTLGQCLNSARAYYPAGGGDAGGSGSYSYSRSFSSSGGGGSFGGGQSPIGFIGAPTGGMRTGGSGGGADGGGSTGDGGASGGGGYYRIPWASGGKKCPTKGGGASGTGKGNPGNGSGAAPVLGVLKPLKGAKGYTVRVDMHEQPHPDAHIFKGNKEWNIDHNGNLREGLHHGKQLETEIPKKAGNAFQEFIKTFVNKVKALGAAAGEVGEDGGLLDGIPVIIFGPPPTGSGPNPWAPPIQS
jgi:hypothetical protein